MFRKNIVNLTDFSMF